MNANMIDARNVGEFSFRGTEAQKLIAEPKPVYLPASLVLRRAFAAQRKAYCEGTYVADIVRLDRPRCSVGNAASGKEERRYEIALIVADSLGRVIALADVVLGRYIHSPVKIAEECFPRLTEYFRAGRLNQGEIDYLDSLFADHF